MEKLSKSIDKILPLGASTVVHKAGKVIINKYGKDILNKIAI
jgi:ribonuclease HIII